MPCRQDGPLPQSCPLSARVLQVRASAKGPQSLQGCLVYFCDHARMSAPRRRELERQVATLGGAVSQNLVPRVTHILADDARGYAARLHIQKDRDVLSCAWLEDCGRAGRVASPRPRDYVHLSAAKARIGEGEEGRDPGVGMGGPHQLELIEGLLAAKSRSSRSGPRTGSLPRAARKFDGLRAAHQPSRDHAVTVAAGNPRAGSAPGTGIW